MGRTVLWHEMFKDEFDAAVAETPVCWLSYGLCEPHGVQSALGLDGLKAHALVERAAAAHGGVVAPPVWWHVHETPLGLAFMEQADAPAAYCTNIPPDLFLRQILYQLRTVERAGFRCAVLVTGHYGGVEVDMKQVCEIYASRRPLRAVALADNEAIRYRDYSGDHAGRCETSQLMALRPALVDATRIPEAPFDGMRFASTHDARGSSRKEGERIVESQIEFLGRLAEALLRSADEETRPWGECIPWSEAEEMWEEMLADRDAWIGSQPAEGFWDYLAERRKRFPLPVA